MEPVLERERDGHQINGDGLCHGVLLGDLHVEPHPDAERVIINGDVWRRVDEPEHPHRHEPI